MHMRYTYAIHIYLFHVPSQILESHCQKTDAFGNISVSQTQLVFFFLFCHLYLLSFWLHYMPAKLSEHFLNEPCSEKRGLMHLCDASRNKQVILSLYHTILTYNNPKKQDFGKHCWKRRKCWFPAFSPFPTMFSLLSKGETISLAKLNMMSANASSLVQYKILSFSRVILVIGDR